LDDTLIWEVSGDGKEFDTFAATTTPGGIGPLDVVRIALALTADGNTGTTLVRVGGINAR
jgi:hypothetical protein